MGVRKHFVNIDGEFLLDRTIRLCRQLGAYRVVVNGPMYNAMYKRQDAEHVELDIVSNEDHHKHTVDKCTNSISQWNSAGRTVCLLGDVFYEESALEEILLSKHSTFVDYSRANRSHMTGKPWGEDFACSFYPSDHGKIKEILESFVQGGASPWLTVAKEFQDFDNKPHRVELGGFTEDFDYPHDYDRWLEHRCKYKNECGQVHAIGE